MKDNWSGLVLDGSAANIRRLKESYFYWKYDLLAIDAFITRDNINELMKKERVWRGPGNLIHPFGRK